MVPGLQVKDCIIDLMKVSVVIPNWNGAKTLSECMDSLLGQSVEADIIVVDDCSTDRSVGLLKSKYRQVELIELARNSGFATAVNTGIERAIAKDSSYVALFNNDAVADKQWLENLAEKLNKNPKAGIATGKILNTNGKYIDSTGEFYSVWGLPYPRGRGESTDMYNKGEFIFGASGGASLYRTKMLQEIGLFDKDFVAYYEDVDLSWRAQLAGWKVAYVPKAIVYHKTSSSYGKVKGAATYHTLKNLPLLLWKNVPWELMPKIWPRLVLAYWGIAGRAMLRGQFGPFFKGIAMGTLLWPKKMFQRYGIQKNRRVSIEYLDSIITHDLPPNAKNLRQLRAKWWRIRGRNP